MKYSIVVAPFPFSDKSARKVRPLLALTEPIGEYHEIVAAYITTQLPDTLLMTDIALPLSFSSLTQLQHPSCIRLHKLFTLTESTLLGKLGNIPDDIKIQVDHAVNRLFRD